MGFMRALCQFVLLNYLTFTISFDLSLKASSSILQGLSIEMYFLKLKFINKKKKKYFLYYFLCLYI